MADVKNVTIISEGEPVNFALTTFFGLTHSSTYVGGAYFAVQPAQIVDLRQFNLQFLVHVMICSS